MLSNMASAMPQVVVVKNKALFLQESLGEEILRMSTDEIVSRTRLLDNEIKVRGSAVFIRFPACRLKQEFDWVFLVQIGDRAVVF